MKRLLALIAHPAVSTAVQLLVVVGEIVGFLLLDEYLDDDEDEDNDF